jgi:rubredoxin
MTPPSSPRAGEPKTDLRASLTDALDYWWNFDEESGQRRTSHATLESIIPSMVAEVLARRMESQGWRAGEAEGGVREATVYAREQLAIALAAIRDADRNFRDDAYCRECGKGPSVLQHDDPDCSLSPLAMADIAMRAARGAIGAALASPEPECGCRQWIERKVADLWEETPERMVCPQCGHDYHDRPCMVASPEPDEEAR